MVELTRILQQFAGGGTPDELAIATVYDEIRRLARSVMRTERDDHTLVPTALANEAWLRLFGRDRASFASSSEFFAAAATTLRRLLVEHGRRRSRLKRGAGMARSDLDIDGLSAPASDERLLLLDAALERLAEFDPDKVRIVELRFFAGLSVEEVAQLVGSSARTVAREWRVARAFLRAELGDTEELRELDA